MQPARRWAPAMKKTVGSWDFVLHLDLDSRGREAW